MKLSPTELKALGHSLLDFNDDKIHDFLRFIEHFPVSGQAPRGMKREKSFIQTLQSCADSFLKYKLLSPNINAVFTYLDESTIDEIVDKFIKPEKVDEIKFGRITFLNTSRMSDSRFKDTADAIAKNITNLKGFHSLSIQRPLSIVFVGADKMKSKAQYKSEIDQIWIKESAAIGLETYYGSIPYIILHELGHRFESKFGHPQGFVEYQSYTTKYSKVDSFSGSEAFAELFAISHFKEQYPEYDEKVNIFCRQMMESFEKEYTHDAQLS